MSNDLALHKAITLLEEHKCSVVLFCAPKECFPYIPEDEPAQFVREDLFHYRDSALRCLITCQTPLDELKICCNEES
jgi:hypothetical protein